MMGTVDTIAVGFDGSPDSTEALRWAARLAARCHAQLKVVHAVGLLEHAGLTDHQAPNQAGAIEVTAEAGLDSGAVQWMVVDGDPCSVLLRLDQDPSCVDLLVVGSRGSGRHAGTLLGSTSLELVEHATVPVVVVPSGTPRFPAGPDAANSN
jgi:nucleotide-binding universal stress UspA family protein